MKKVAIITGGTRGIGKQIAILLAKNNVNVVINSRGKTSPSKALKELQAINETNCFLQFDVTNPLEIKNAFSKIITKFGKVDILINNAGIIRDKKIEHLSYDDWDNVIDVNLNGTFNCIKEIIPLMKENGGGNIINISSLIGQTGGFGQSNYAASKGGIISLTKTVAKEYAKYNIICNAIAPGYIVTDMTKSIPEPYFKKIIKSIPMQRFGSCVDVAILAKFIALEAKYITGQVFNINGGLYA